VREDAAELQQRIKEAVVLIDAAESAVMMKSSDGAKAVRFMCVALRAVLTQPPEERAKRLKKITEVVKSDRK